MRKGKLLGALAFGVAFIINPAFVTGCLSTEFSFGETEMVALVDLAQTQHYTTTTKDGVRYEIAVALTQSVGEDKKTSALESAIRDAHACTGRSFMRSAAACMDASHLPVVGTITVTRLGAETTIVANKDDVEGRLTVHGRKLDSAVLDLSGGEHRITLFSDDAKTFEVRHIVVDGQRLVLAAGSERDAQRL